MTAGRAPIPQASNESGRMLIQRAVSASSLISLIVGMCGLVASLAGISVKIEHRIDPRSIALLLDYQFYVRARDALRPALRNVVSTKSDSSANPRRSQLVMLEAGVPLAQPHAPHEEILKLGRGRFSHWDQHIHFSSSDGSDPRFNERAYVARVRGTLGLSLPVTLVLLSMILAYAGNSAWILPSIRRKLGA